MRPENPSRMSCFGFTSSTTHRASPTNSRRMYLKSYRCRSSRCQSGTLIAAKPSGRYWTENLRERKFFDPLMALSRSEEHTSELQSRGHLVCRLLLEKKKKKNKECNKI